MTPYISGSALSEKLLTPFLPLEVQYPETYWMRPALMLFNNSIRVDGVKHYEVLYRDGGAMGEDSFLPSQIRMDPRLPEVQHRIVDVLRTKGYNVAPFLPSALGGQVIDAPVDCERCGGIGEIGIEVGGVPDRMEPCPSCDNGYRNDPADATEVSARLLAASIAGVDAGKGVVRGFLGEWVRDIGRPGWVRWSIWGNAVAYSSDRQSNHAWGIREHPSLTNRSGPETGLEGRNAVDADLIDMGYAFLDSSKPFGVQTPSYGLEER